jgi:hypothetical protein
MKFMETRLAGAELFHTDTERKREIRTDGSTYITKIIVAFANFSKAPTKQPDLIAGKEFHEEYNVLNPVPSFTSTSSKNSDKMRY